MGRALWVWVPLLGGVLVGCLVAALKGAPNTPDCAAHGGHMQWQPTGQFASDVRVCTPDGAACKPVPVWANTCVGARR